MEISKITPSAVRENGGQGLRPALLIRQKRPAKPPSHPLPVWHGSRAISCFFLSISSKLSGNLRTIFM